LTARPPAARFEQTIRDQLTLGRPDRVAVVFGRRVSRQTPGRFHTRVINSGTEPAIQVHYCASKVKQYLQEGWALRTETTVNDTYDFGIGRLLTTENWEALLRVGHDINQRLLDAQLQACACAPDAATLARVVLPSSHDGQPAPGLRFGDPRVMALVASLCAFTHLLEGLTNRSLRTLVAGLIPGYTSPQMTYDLRRLRRKHLIERLRGTHRYKLTPDGRRLAVFSPRPTPGSSARHWPSSTRSSRTRSPSAPHSADPGANSNSPRRPNCRRRDHGLKGDRSVTNRTTERS
jgi:hypothetical protein